MSAGLVIDCATIAVLIVSVIALYRLCRSPRPPYLNARWDDVRQAWVNEEEHDVGPDNLRLIEELDAHLDQQFAQLAGLYERLGPPDVDAGCDRLRAAIRDEQQKGETA
jgi:hypothetical protein